MIELWIPITLAAAFFQNVRSAVQKHLTGALSDQGAAYSRFLFALPWALLYLVLLLVIQERELPTPNRVFLMYVLFGSVSQILATVCLLRSFNHRSFAVGTTLSKLEVVIVALFGVLILNDTLGALAQFAIALSAVGLIMLSAGQNKISLQSLLRNLTHGATLYGLAAAVFLGASVVCFRGASLSLALDNALLSAAFTLAIALLLQTLLMGIYLFVVEPRELTRVVCSWRWSSIVGISGMLASACWFTAFTLQNASYVRALGQVELLFTLLVTTRVFREKLSWKELLGCTLTALAISGR